MNVRDMMAVLGVAAATTALAVALTAPDQVDAVDEQEEVASITPLISQPTLKLGGLEIRLTMDKPNYRPGDKPVITIEASNPTDQRVETSVWMGMTSSSLSSRFSRAPMLPNYLWSKDIPLALEPGETRRSQFATDTELSAGTTVSVTMSDRDQKAAFAKLLDLSSRAR
jgi:hypothetical protein